jgi:penicillin-binding protein 1A
VTRASAPWRFGPEREFDRVAIGNRRRGGLWWRIPVALLLWLPFAAPVVAIVVGVTTIRGWARDLPAEPDLAAWTAAAPRTSRMYAADGTLLAELPFTDGPAVGRREVVDYAALPPVLVQAILAAEDVRFFAHDGVDLQAVARAAWANYRAGKVVEGASTITQQVARNLLPVEIGSERTLRRKVREALLARRIEQRWTKPEIFAAYANLVFLGANAYGVAAAARAYFDRDLAELGLAEAALLAGLIQAPGRLDPYLDPVGAKARRDEVLARMQRAKMITAEARAAAAATPLVLAPPPVVYGTRLPWYTEAARRLVIDAVPERLAAGGLVIETAAQPALDARLATVAVDHTDGLARGRAAPEAAVVVVDHRTGYIEGLVGGRAWGASQFDRALQGCRQPGSAWKPIVYAAALEKDAITPGTPLRDAPIAEYDAEKDVHWKPRSGGRFRGVALAADALASSLNAPAIDVLDRVGAPAVIDLARRLGIATSVDDVRPMALGASCVKPIDLVRAFATLARRGWAIAPRLVVRVRRGDDVVFDAAPPEDPGLDPARRLDRLAAVAGAAPDARVSAGAGTGTPVVDERSAFLVDTMLAQVIERGTAHAARALGRPAAGKTGTTNDNTDAWFVGFTGRVAAAVWIGHDDPTIDLGPRDDGAQAALPLWMRVVREAERGRPEVAVPGEPPAGIERARVDRETGLLAAPGAGGALELWFKQGTAPTEVAGRPSTAADDFGRTSREF